MMPMFLLILTTVVWGTTFFIVKDTVRDVDAFFIVFVRNLIAAIPMSLYVLARDRQAFFDRTTLVRGAILGFLLAATYGSQTLGLKYTTSGHSAFITGSAVIFVPILLFLIWGVRMRPVDILSILGVFAGLFLLTWDGDGRINPGDLITLITVASYAAHLVTAGRFVHGVDVTAMIAHQFNFAALFSLVGYLLAGGGGTSLAPRSVCALVYLGLCGTLFCYFVTVWAQQHVSAVQVALIFALEPVFAAFFAWWFAAEKLQAKEFAGMFLILAGILAYQTTRGLRGRRSADGEEGVRPASAG